MLKLRESLQKLAGALLHERAGFNVWHRACPNAPRSLAQGH
jgi:hypothetical protein